MVRTVSSLGEICDLGGGEIKTGPFGSQLHQHDYRDEGTPVVMPKNIVGGQVSEDGIARICKEDVDRLCRHRLVSGDIIYGRRGEIGRHAFITSREAGWLCGTGCLRIHLGCDGPVAPHFLHYYLEWNQIVEWIRNHAVGATMPNLNTSILRQVPIEYPDLPVQHRIASILSAYDDLIENNTRRIQILEEMAQRIYREWFVHFRFPGHEKVKMVESELGMIPEGWESRSLGELCEYINRGISPKYDEDSECRVINQRCIRDNKINYELTRGNTKRVPEDKYVKYGDILVNSTGVGTLGRVAQVSEYLENHTVDSHVTIVRPKKEIHVEFFGLALIELEDYFEHLGAGATGQTELNRNRVSETQIINPPHSIQKTFDNIVAPTRKLIISLQKKNRILRQSRDLLLPKLISGQIDVSDLDITIGADAA